MTISWYPPGVVVRSRDNRAERSRSTGRGPSLVHRAATEVVPKQIERQDPDTVASPAQIAGIREILVVDTDPQTLHAAQIALQSLAGVEIYSNFRDARTRLAAKPPDLLVTNLRLERYNGLHLVYVAARTKTRSIVYGTHDDLVLAREAQAIGAFYERRETVIRALSSYVHATLPPVDRRSLTVLDRRVVFRGGRRCSDA